MKTTNSFLLITFIILIFSATIATAESGTINISNQADYSTNPTSSGFVGGATDFTKIRFDSTNWNEIGEYYISFNDASNTFLLTSNSTTFTCVAPDVCNGAVAYNKVGNIILWDFGQGNVLTSNTITLTYLVNIFDSNNIGQGTQVYAAESVGGNIPVCLANTFSSTRCAFGISGGVPVRQLSATHSTVMLSSSIGYNIIYPIESKYSGSIDKSGALNTKIETQNSTAQQFIESSFNTIDFNLPLIPYTTGIYINVSTSSGTFTKVLINSTGTTGGTGASTITTDKASYQRGDNIAITATNNEPGTIYLTGYGPTGIMTDILWNTQVTAGQTKIFNKIIQADYPIGDYQITAATTSSYVPIVAIAYFNISLPGNTTNALGLLWDQNLYLVGNTGIINSQGNFNTTNMVITSPGGATTNYNFPANATNATAITLNEVGIWSGKLTDSGNLSNNITSNTTVSAGDPSDNETFAECKTQVNYICFDHSTYQRGQNFKLEWKRTLFNIVAGTRLVIYNPSMTKIINQSINGTYYSGYFSGYFSTTAELGVYWARLEKPDGEIITEGYTALEGQAITPTPTPTTGTPGISNQAANLMNVFTYMAFYGLVIFLGIFFSAIKLMTAHGAQANGQALVIVMTLVATMEALIGLFDPFKIYIIVISWIFAAIYFRQTRTTATGE